jgi:hypothetical protein
MNLTKTLLILLAALFIASCATTRVGPEYEAGRLYAYDIAKKDAWDLDCYWYKRKVEAAFKARDYTETLRSQGKSQMFIEGFYYGYERTYWDQIRVKCGR